MIAVVADLDATSAHHRQGPLSPELVVTTHHSAMGIINKLLSEFIDVIEWLDSSNDTIAYRFQRHNNEIKMGAKLTVRPGQLAVFVNEGQVADVFQPGLYELTTQNLPIMTTLQSWPYAFNSPFKAEVYFFSTKVFTNLKWGTANPITARDPELGPVRIRAFGTYHVRVQDPALLLQGLISTDGLFQVDEMSDQIRNTIITSFATWFGQARIPLLDFAAHYQDMGDQIREALKPEIATFGLELTKLLVANVSLPPEVEEALDKRSSMNLLGNMQEYSQFQAANAVEASAQNSGGNPALDFGVGIAMGQQLMNNMQPGQVPAAAQRNMTQPMEAQAAAASPPPLPHQAAEWYIAINGQQAGPFTLEQLRSQPVVGETLAWKAGMPGWVAAAALPELNILFQDAPPPLPGI
jgi:membrane protease subunit (stomatin/prohibitin family)